MSIQYYERHADEFFRRTVDADMAATRARFVALVPRGGRILDAGCGSGRDARAFRDLGFEVTAIEAAAPLATLATQHAGLPVQVMTFDQITWREAFDGVWASASLLHVPRRELTAAVQRLRDSLARGGSLFMSFKYGTGEREVDGRRFTDLDEAGAQQLLIAVGGLEVLSIVIDEDVRAECAGQRWLSLICRRV